MRLAAHQPNFAPWIPFFYKMAMVDVFIILKEVQFEKNNFQNRYITSNGWVTKPVMSGIEPIYEKRYVDGQSLFSLNMQWIKAIKDTLNIQTRLTFDFATGKKATENLIELIKFHADGEEAIYVTNPDAKDKYLDEELMKSQDIKIEYCIVPKHLQIHTFEAFEKLGIESIINQLPKPCVV